MFLFIACAEQAQVISISGVNAHEWKQMPTPEWGTPASLWGLEGARKSHCQLSVVLQRAICLTFSVLAGIEGNRTRPAKLKRRGVVVVFFGGSSILLGLKGKRTHRGMNRTFRANHRTD